MKSLLIFFVLLCTSLMAQSLDINDPKWKWMDDQIEEEFKVFEQRGITLEMLDTTIRKKPQISFGHLLKRFQIIDGHVYGPAEDGDWTMLLLQKLVHLYPVPNVDIIIYPGDTIFNSWILPGPVLAGTSKMKKSKNKMVHFPKGLWKDWEEKLVPAIEKACAQSPWESKGNKLFWRGINGDADNYNNIDDWTKIPRGKLCYIGMHYPDLMDVAFSGTAACYLRPELHEQFRQFFPFKRASWEEFVSNKYIMDIDGYVASTAGCEWKLMSNCAVFKQKSRFTLWFYKILVPWVHYVPIEYDLSDLVEKIKWARDHDAEVRQIAENGRALAQDHFMPEHMFLYNYKVLLKYASLQRFVPQPR